MMGRCMGGGIGATQVFGWPLSDWAVVLLMFVLSVLTVTFLGAVIGVITSWFRSPDRSGEDVSSHRNPEEPVR